MRRTIFFNTQKLLVSLLVVIGFLPIVTAQNFLHVDGKNIVNGAGENVILRGIGTGNWMIQEGYMMQTAGLAGTQHEFRNKLIETIGEEKTDEFYDSWLKNHFRRVDVDSMVAWGFNCVRVAMHYKWFTLPIEEEPVQGENTWIETGFNILDSLLDWCGDKEMYLILDLHGAPGGQGKNADISDYDPSKPALWESEFNKSKTVALWRKLAERFADEPWLGGYDLINEVNWTFKEGNNSQLLNIYKRITDTIREVDENHIIYIEGNSFANDFSGLTPPWDDNMVYSFHKYWNYNNKDAIQWVLDLRNQTNRPIWLGETGENSNTWFTNLVVLAEENNIGWSWWPVKKSGINNILRVKTNDDYLKLIDVWKGNGSMSAEDAFNAVMTYSDNHRFENCVIQYDVIDALIRQPKSLETKPFKEHTTASLFFAADYDLGRVGYAYYDTDTADYHLNLDFFGEWNTGWSYRSDGVDIEPCEDSDTTMGYHVGWVRPGEWLQYTVTSESHAVYDVQIRTASEDATQLHFEVDGKIASKSITIPATGGWDIWKTNVIEDIILPVGECKVRLVFEQGGANINYFTFVNASDVAGLAFEKNSVYTEQIENKIILNLNKPVTSEAGEINASDFQLIVNNTLAEISSVYLNEKNSNQLIVESEKDLFSIDNIKLSYTGASVMNDGQSLEQFSAQTVENRFYQHYEVPGKIEAEDFFVNNGFTLEDCLDEGDGKNTAYANNGDYLDYLVDVAEAGIYKVKFRVAALSGTPEILFMNTKDDKITANKALKINPTGGWQNWETQSVNVELPKGKIVIRIYSRDGEYNINWFSFDLITATGIRAEHEALQKKTKAYPNPADKLLKLDFQSEKNKHVEVYDITGVQLFALSTSDKRLSINTAGYPIGTYIINVLSEGEYETLKVQIKR